MNNNKAASTFSPQGNQSPFEGAQLDSSPNFGALVLDTVEAQIIVLNAQGEIVLFNRACEKLTGYTYAEVKGKPFWDLLLLPEEREAVHGVFAQLSAGQFPNEFENYWVTRSGELRRLTWRNSALMGSDGNVAYVMGTGIDVTERRLAEQALVESERRYSNLFLNHRAVMLVIDPQDGRILDANPSACKFYGHTYEDLVSMKIGDFNTLSPQQVAEAMEQARQMHLNYFNFQHRLADGQVRDVEVYSSPIVMGGKTILHSIIHDVTERKRSEAQRERHLAQMNRLVEVSKRVLEENTVEGLMQSIVDAARELVEADIGIAGHSFVEGEFSVGATSRRKVASGCPPGSYFKMEMGGVYEVLLADKISIRLSAAELQEHPRWWGLPEGHTKLQGLLGARLIDEQGQSKGILMVSCKENGDFTAEDEGILIQLAALASLAWQHIEARREAERRVDELDIVINAMSEAVGICDLKGRLLKVNPAMTDVFGFDPSGKNLRELAAESSLSHRDGRKLSTEELPSVRALKGEAVTNMPLRLHNSRGQTLTIQVSTAPLCMGGQKWGAVIAIHDVSDLQSAEEALQHYAHKLEVSNRDLESFAFIASHDLQEPLRKVQAFAQQLKKRYGDRLDEGGLDYLERMDNAANRMRVMIIDLLSYSRVNTSQPFTLIDLNECVADAISDLDVRREAISGRVEAEPLPMIEGDATQMHQLFLNLIGNALKFHRPDAPPEVCIRAAAIEPGQVEILVQDNGIGMEMQYKDRIFQPFQRLHGRGEYEGSGIGLAICRKIVERHAGTIDVRSTPGEGTIFVIHLPLQQAQKI